METISIIFASISAVVAIAIVLFSAYDKVKGKKTIEALEELKKELPKIQEVVKEESVKIKNELDKKKEE